MMSVLGISGGEIILILLAMLVFAAVAGTIAAVVIWLSRTTKKAVDIASTKAAPSSGRESVPPVILEQKKRFCPQCRNEMAPDAPQGLCPQCLARAAFETQAGAQQQQWTAAMPIEQIAQFFPQLEILELLGHGGMGVVYKARQPHLDRFVALKILSPELSRNPAFAERFSREARALARLNHPNIVAVYESGKAGDFYYLVMEYVDGLNLSQIQAARKRLSPEEAFAIVPKICDALQYAHDEGVVHRDIKPANILIDKKGRVKIADFGLAKMAGREITGLGLTASRGMMGTPQYMAPEQLEKPLEVDHRADIYSLGVVFYEMLTGELPLGRFPVPSKKVHVDVRLDEIVLRTLEKEPELRYQQASQIKSDVETVVNTPGVQSTAEAGATMIIEPAHDEAQEEPTYPPRVSSAGPDRPALNLFWRRFAISLLILIPLSLALLFAGYALLSRRVVHDAPLHPEPAQPIAAAAPHAGPSPFQKAFAKVRCRVFEADAAAVDEIVPVENRSATNALVSWQIAALTIQQFARMTNAARQPGLLADHSDLVRSWPRQAFSIPYAVGKTGFNGTGIIGGTVGLGRTNEDLLLRIEANVSHTLMTIPADGKLPEPRFAHANILTTNVVPESGMLIALVPTTGGMKPGYLVMAYEIDEVEHSASIVAIGQPGRWTYSWWDMGGRPVTPNDEWVRHAGTAALALVLQRQMVNGHMTVEFRSWTHSNYDQRMAVGPQIGQGCELCYINDNSNGDFRKYLDKGGKVDLVVSFSATPWHEIATILEGSVIETNGGIFRFPRLLDSGNQVTVDWSCDFDPDYDVVIAAVDSNGNRTLPIDVNRSGQFVSRENRHQFSRLMIPKRNIEKFVVLKRPITSRVFESIPTRPKITPAS